MKSLGVIETRGLVAAIQAVDAACKAAGVTCIGYRKVGSGRVSVCFEGEISAIHTAIERGVAVASTSDTQVRSLVIARPEHSVVEALSNLKGHPSRAKIPEMGQTEIVISTPPSQTDQLAAEPVTEAKNPKVEDKVPSIKKGKRHD